MDIHQTIERYLETLSDAEIRQLATVELVEENAPMKPPPTIEQVSARLSLLAERHARLENAVDAIAATIDQHKPIIDHHTTRIGELDTLERSHARTLGLALDRIVALENGTVNALGGAFISGVLDPARCRTAGCSLHFSHGGPCRPTERREDSEHPALAAARHVVDAARRQAGQEPDSRD